MECILEGKPEIDYPLNWDYKVILLADEDAKALFAKILVNEKYTFKASHASKAGKYESYLLSIYVKDEAHRLGLFALLKQHSKYVL